MLQFNRSYLPLVARVLALTLAAILLALPVAAEDYSARPMSLR